MDRVWSTLRRCRLVWAQHKAAILLAGLTSFLAGVTIIWLTLDRQPPWWDDSMYLTRSLVMFDALLDGGVIGYVRRFFSIFSNRPPLITVLPTPFYLLFGRDPRYAFGVNLLSIPVLVWSVYRIGKEFWGERPGLIAAYAVGTMPLLYGLARWYLVEFSLTALVSLAICLLLESKGIRRFRETLYFGIVCSAGLLLKVTFPLFLFLPFLYVVFRSVRASTTTGSAEIRASASPVKTVLALAAPSLLLAAPWYFKNLRATLALVQFAGFSPDADTYGTGYVFSAGALKKYLLELAGSGTSYYYALLVMILIVLVIGTGRTRAALDGFGKDPAVVLLLWGLPFLAFLFGRNKNLRYVAPFLPIFGLILGFALDFALRMLRKWQAPLLCLVLIFPAVSVLQKSFFILGDRVPRLNRFLCVEGFGDVARKYERASWPQEEILQTLARQTKLEPGHKEIIMLGTDTAYFNADNFQLAATRDKLPFEVTSSAHSTDLEGLLRSLDSASFFIYKEGGEPESPFYNSYQPALVEKVQRDERFVELPDHWSLPDGGRVRIFENTATGWAIVKQGFVPSGLETIPGCAVNFGGQIELSGLSIEQSDASLRVKYRWLCFARPDRQYWCFTHVLDEEGKVVGFLDHPIVGNRPPMTLWRKGDIAIEELQFNIPPALSHKRLRLLLGLYDVPSGQRLSVRSFTLSGAAHASLADSDTAILVIPEPANQSGANHASR